MKLSLGKKSKKSKPVDRLKDSEVEKTTSPSKNHYDESEAKSKYTSEENDELYHLFI